jgi:hypothetical protein
VISAALNKTVRRLLDGLRGFVPTRLLYGFQAFMCLAYRLYVALHILYRNLTGVR